MDYGVLPGPPPGHPTTAGARVTAVAGAAEPFTARALSGVVESAARRPDGSLAHRVTVVPVEFTGPAGSPLPLARYLAAARGPLWRQAPAILGHLQRGQPGPAARLRAGAWPAGGTVGDSPRRGPVRA
jgi:hypothetical protein